MEELSAKQTQPNAQEQVSTKIMLTPVEIERDYSIPKSTQAKGRMAGTFAPFIKRGRSVFVLKSDLDRWLAGLRRNSTTERNSGYLPPAEGRDEQAS